MISDDDGASHLTAPSEGNFADSLHHPSTRVSKGSVGDHSTGVSRSLRCASLYELRPEPTLGWTTTTAKKLDRSTSRTECRHNQRRQASRLPAFFTAVLRDCRHVDRLVSVERLVAAPTP